MGMICCIQCDASRQHTEPVQLFISCGLMVWQFYPGKPRPATGSWHHCFILLFFSMCVNDEAIQHKKENSRLRHSNWDERVEREDDWNRNERKREIWRSVKSKKKDLEGGVKATIGLIESVCVCVPISRGLVRDRAWRALPNMVT